MRASATSVELVGVLETHTHADHVSGHGRLALEHGLPVHVHAAAERGVPARAARRRRRRSTLGEVVIRTIHTPGHRPEHCAFAVIDRSRGDEPWLVLTGDSLFVGDAARPDLAVEALEGAEGLFHSLHRLVELGDGVEVYPGPRRRLALRRGDELEGVDDDRLRAPLQPCARRDARGLHDERGRDRSRRGRRTWRRSSS